MTTTQNRTQSDPVLCASHNRSGLIETINRRRAGCDHMKADRHQYEMQIETPSGISADESVRRLRSFLKMAIRSYGIRCVTVARITHGSQEGVEDASESTIGANHDN